VYLRDIDNIILGVFVEWGETRWLDAIL